MPHPPAKILYTTPNFHLYVCVCANTIHLSSSLPRSVIWVMSTGGSRSTGTSSELLTTPSSSPVQWVLVINWLSLLSDVYSLHLWNISTLSGCLCNVAYVYIDADVHVYTYTCTLQGREKWGGWGGWGSLGRPTFCTISRPRRAHAYPYPYRKRVPRARIGN